MAEELRVWSIPMRTRFRGIDVREGVFVRGPAGWGEFSPFWGYDAGECLPWWRAAQEAAYGDWHPARRTSVPVNVTVPAVGPDRAASVVRDSSGCRTAKVKVAEPGQSEARIQQTDHDWSLSNRVTLACWRRGPYRANP